MKYTFHKVQCHPKIKKLTGWYLELRPDDLSTLMELHVGVCSMYVYRFQHDPHMVKEIAARRAWSPVEQAQLWLGSIHKHLLDGKPLLINMNGGFMFMEGAIILDTVYSDNIRWGNRFDDEIITLARWEGSKHWYISSNKLRVFVPEKYNTYEAALAEALQFVPVERITSQ